MDRILITGGAGFIGSNATNYYLKKGYEVEIFDNFSRNGTIQNLRWLEDQHESKNLTIIKGDTRYDLDKLQESVNNAQRVLHLAAQVAVTTSVTNPREDFEINALGTFNILEAIRHSKTRPPIIYSSTNKVYGGMGDIKIIEKNNRYAYDKLPEGIEESRILDFHSPYGCSKGTADQYVRDYSRIYGIDSMVFRQSCIYGYRQFGMEDQGWVAWFVIASMLDKPITIYGDGKQVRDVLFVEDLIAAYDAGFNNMKKYSGSIYNIGGGPSNQMSILELISQLKTVFNKDIKYSFSNWRPGDQPVYVSNIEKARKELNWQPKIGVMNGVQKLSSWITNNRKLFE